MKIRTNDYCTIDLKDSDKISLDENIIFFQESDNVKAINMHEIPCISEFIERHNDWECEIVDHIIEMVADDFFAILENEFFEEKTIDVNETVNELLKFYIPC